MGCSFWLFSFKGVLADLVAVNVKARTGFCAFFHTVSDFAQDVCNFNAGGAAKGRIIAIDFEFKGHGLPPVLSSGRPKPHDRHRINPPGGNVES